MDGKVEYRCFSTLRGGERCGPLAVDKVGAIEGVGRRGLSDWMLGVVGNGVGGFSV